MSKPQPSNDGVVLIARAADFAARAHLAQRRKGDAQEPYINHLAEVAKLLADATAGRDATLIAAGWLHDTLEDTATEREELETMFGPAVASIVAEVTDDKSLVKAERKRLQVETAPRKSPQARLLKIADKISNLHSIALSPPRGWDLTRRVAYLDWAEAVVAGCRGGSAELDQAFDDALRKARSAVENTN